VAGSGRSRKWQVTINNPGEKGYSHEEIRNRLALFKGCLYWCLCDEIGENGTYHTHIYFVLRNAAMFSVVKDRFEGGHFEIANGTSQQNRDYVRKEGKHEKGKKKETNLLNTFEEWGEMPIEQQGKRNDLSVLFDMIKEGMSNYEIIDSNPEYMMNIEKIERVRQLIRQNDFKSKFRELEVVYIWGRAGSGKTRGVMERFGYESVYRVTDYRHPFDNYAGQDVLVFDEFYSGAMRFNDLLNYLDGYPLELPCRYNNRVACYTKVFIISNIPLEKQYCNVQAANGEAWRALMRRIHRVAEYSGESVIEYSSVEEYTKRPAVHFLDEKQADYVESLFTEVEYDSQY